MAETEEEVAFDERFEFDAPHFYDFDEGSPPERAPADGWFDTDGPKGLTTPKKAQNEQQECKPAAGAAAGAPENVNTQSNVAGKAGGSKGKEWRRALASITNNTSGKAAQQPQKQQGTKRRSAAKSAGDEAGSSAAAAAGTGPGSSKARPGSGAARQQHPRQRGASRQGTSLAGAAAPSSEATSPRLHPRQRAHTGEHKTSEQLELERVEQEKAAAAALRRHNAETFKHVLGAPPPPVAHSSRPLTEPMELKLCTSKRKRLHSMETRSMGSPFKSMAEQIAAFEGRLPGKSKLGNSSGTAVPPPQLQPPPQRQQHSGHHGATLTVPLSPQFATKKRVRPPRFKPRELVEAEEMAAMPKFKARPVNKRIMQDRSGQLGVPQVDARPPTVPEPFAFKTDQRAAEHAGSAGADHHAGTSASALPAGTFVFAAAGGEGGRVTRSTAAAKKAAGQQSRWTGQMTQQEPFQLATDARGATKRSAAADPQHEEQARPAKRARRSAARGPFQLATDVRGAAEEARLEGIRRQQEEQARHDAEFKALPLNMAALAGAWKPPPVAPTSLTVPQEVTLHSDARAEQRRAFDEAVATKQAEQETEQRQALALQAAAEEEELRQLRKGMVPKARPLPGRL